MDKSKRRWLQDSAQNKLPGTETVEEGRTEASHLDPDQADTGGQRNDDSTRAKKIAQAGKVLCGVAGVKAPRTGEVLSTSTPTSVPT